MHLFLERSRQTRDAQSFSIYLVSLQNAPKQSSQIWARLNASNKKADQSVLISLHNSLPRSVRPLLGLSDEDEGAHGKQRTVLDVWDDAIAAQPPGSRRRAFMEAGKAATQERMHRVN